AARRDRAQGGVKTMGEIALPPTVRFKPNLYVAHRTIGQLKGHGHQIQPGDPLSRIIRALLR
ncbi:hypothetical protein, partial [Mesorhizobium sp.]|uniref:hypothetical protein n=1 Tax=Mesorhizobium sp. TaxID=1871066 RepID=UPI00257E5CD6